MKKKIVWIGIPIVVAIVVIVGILVYGFMKPIDPNQSIEFKDLAKTAKDFYVPTALPAYEKTECTVYYLPGSTLFSKSSVTGYGIELSDEGRKIEIATMIMRVGPVEEVEYRKVKIRFWSLRSNTISIGIDAVEIGLVGSWENDQAKAIVKSDLKMLIDQAIDSLGNVQ